MKVRYLILIVSLFLFDEKMLYATTMTSEPMSEAAPQAQTTISASKPKVIYLLSTPRSCSTAFLRMMYGRGDFEIINGPGVQTYFSPYRLKKPSLLKNYGKAKNKISQKITTCRNIFVKELGYTACEYLLPEGDFLKQQNYYPVFLVRNPHHALISHAKKRKIDFLPHALEDIMSYKKLYELFHKFQQTAINQPLIVLTEELAAHSSKIVPQFCQRVGIPFKKENLSWRPLDGNFSFEKEWNCVQPAAQVLHFCDKVATSTGFSANNLSCYAVDEGGQPTFEEIENPEHRNFYKQLYLDNLPYYQLFLDEYAKQQQASENSIDTAHLKTFKSSYDSV